MALASDVNVTTRMPAIFFGILDARTKKTTNDVSSLNKKESYLIDNTFCVENVLLPTD